MQNSLMSQLWDKLEIGTKLFKDGELLGTIQDKRVKHGATDFQVTVENAGVLMFISITPYNRYLFCIHGAWE